MALIINPYLSHINYLEAYGFDHKSISYYINWRPNPISLSY